MPQDWSHPSYKSSGCLGVSGPTVWAYSIMCSPTRSLRESRTSSVACDSSDMHVVKQHGRRYVSCPIRLRSGKDQTESATMRLMYPEPPATAFSDTCPLRCFVMLLFHQCPMSFVCDNWGTKTANWFEHCSSSIHRYDQLQE